MALSQSSQVAALLKTFTPQIERAFLQAMRDTAGRVDTAALVDALTRRDVEGAVQLLQVNQAALFQLEDAIRSTYVAGGQAVALPVGLRGGFGFNGRHPRAERWIATEGATLIQGIQADTLSMARTVIVAGLEGSVAPPAIARSLVGSVVGKQRVGGFLGLTTQQADGVLRMRSILSNSATMGDYFVRSADGKLVPRYKLSDRRFDKVVRDAIKAGKLIPKATLDQIEAAHRSKALTYRGRVIAKDQTFAAQAAGREEGYRQIIERDDVENVTVRWQHNLSEFPRPDHVAMSGTVIDLGETFDFDDAKMEHPHDPAGGARHNIGCRCIAVYRIVVAKE